MIDNGFQFNWRGMSREPAMAAPQGGANLSNTLGASQAAQMQGYRPLPSMQGYQPTLSGRQVNPDSSPVTQPEIAMAQTEQRMKMLMDKFQENEEKIAQLKQEYAQLQQEESTASDNLERDIAANRAGIGDSNQYNVWRSRVESREAQDKAREEDKKGKLSTLKSKVNGALLDLSYARGGKQEATARKIYQDALRDYREAGGLDEFTSDGVSSTTTLFDTKNFIRQHRNKNGNWDSEENKQEAIRMAKSLGDEGASLLDEIYYQSTQGKVDSNAAAFKNAVKKELQKIDMTVHGEGDVVPIEVNGKSYDAKIVGNANGKGFHFVVDGKTYTL